MDLYGGQKSNFRFMSLFDNSCRGILTHVVIYINSCRDIHAHLHLGKLMPHMLYVAVSTNPCRRIYRLMSWYALTHVVESTNSHRGMH